MSLIIGATPFSQWERLESLFQRLDWTVHPNDPSALSGAVTSSSSPCLLLHTRPELAVAQAMEQDVSPGDALSQWHQAAQILLDVLRASRSQCVMLEVNSVLTAPAKLLEWLQTNRPSLLTLPSGFHRFAKDSTATGLPNERNLLLATQLVAQSPNLQSLLASLEASTVPLMPGQYAVPSVNVEQLTHQPEQENRAVLNQLFKVQEQLEQYDVTNKELKEQLRIANRDLGQARKRLAAMEASPFWRITAPARLGLRAAYKLLRKTKRFLARR